MNPSIINKVQQAAEQNLLNIEEAKQNGKRVIGFYCLFSPMELAVAAGLIPVPLCGNSHNPIAAAEEVLPRNLCPMIKASYGFAATGTCPFFKLSDMLAADTTCDGKKKMFELLSQFKPMHILQLPQNQDPATALPFWKIEVARFKNWLESMLQRPIQTKAISAAISLMNRERKARKGLMDLLKQKPSPLSGLELLTILHKISFFADKEFGIRLLHEITQELVREHNQSGSSRLSLPRILLTGVPIGVDSGKVIRLIETAGAQVVCLESCGGYKGYFLVDENKDPLDAIAEQYLQTPCSVMSPNNGRLDLLAQLIKEFSIEGVVDLTWQACHTYNVESYTIERFVRENYRLPFLHLETDYSEADTETLRVRIEAFLEMVR